MLNNIFIAFLDPKNIQIDEKIVILSLLGAEIW